MENTRSTTTSHIGLLEAVACASILIFVTNILPFYWKTGFVEPTGNIKIAPFLGFVLAVGLLLRKGWARQGGIALAAFLLLASLNNVLFFSPERPGFWVTAALAVGLLYGLIFSKHLKAYVG